jgi:glycosyltransferase involved in cell wall biosynthesis
MITVLFATYNGGKTLPTVLDAYRKLDLPDEEWKLVIVDNGSTDNTQEIVKAFLPLLPVTLLFEPRTGKNAALNTGLSQIAGDLLVLTDDDVLPNPNWLKEFRSAADTQPTYSIFGGPILPEWASPPDPWILSWVHLAVTFALLDAHEEGPIDIFKVYGPNMAIRSSIFQMGYKFNETIGPKGFKYAQGSETEFLKRLHQAGFKAWHCKNAIIRHMIRSFQMDRKWILARAIRYGRGMYRLGMSEYSTWKSGFWGIQVRLLLRMLKRIYLIGKAKLRGDAETIFREHWRLNYLYGTALEARIMFKEKNKTCFRIRSRICFLS